jgi:hypothetical protein
MKKNRCATGVNSIPKASIFAETAPVTEMTNPIILATNKVLRDLFTSSLGRSCRRTLDIDQSRNQRLYRVAAEKEDAPARSASQSGARALAVYDPRAAPRAAPPICICGVRDALGAPAPDQPTSSSSHSCWSALLPWKLRARLTMFRPSSTASSRALWIAFCCAW